MSVSQLAVDQDRVQPLVATRDILLPVLVDFMAHASGMGFDVEADIHLDYLGDCLVVKVFRLSTQKLVKRFIAREDIESRAYMAAFKPMLRQMVCEVQT